MRFISLSVASALIAFVVPATADVMQPPSGDCWNTTLEIFTAEMAPIFDDALMATQRTYMLCPKVYTIGILADVDFPSTPFPSKGDYPMIIVNPNVHLKCAEPRTCIFSGGTHQLASLRYASYLMDIFIERTVGQALPQTYVVDTSNLLVEGVTFSNSIAPPSDTRESPVAFDSPGVDMVLSNCLWTNSDTTNPPMAAIEYSYYAPPGYRRGTSYYNSLTVVDSVIENNVFQYSLLWATSGNNPRRTNITNQIIFEGTTIKNNIVQGVISGDSTPPGRSSLFSPLYTNLVFKNSEIVNNTSGRANADINLLASQLVFENSVIENNPIAVDLSPDCTNVQVFTGPNGVLTQDGCLELTSGSTEVTSPVTNPVATPVVSPVASPVATPVVSPVASPVATPIASPITMTPVATTSLPVSVGSSAPIMSAPVDRGIAPTEIATSAPIMPSSTSPVMVSPVATATIAPVLASPVSAAPVSAAPVTTAPVSAAPVTSAPVTEAPITAAPVTTAPATTAPVTAAPVTAAPMTAFPDMPSIRPSGSGIPSVSPSGSHLPSAGPSVTAAFNGLQGSAAASIISNTVYTMPIAIVVGMVLSYFL